MKTDEENCEGLLMPGSRVEEKCQSQHYRPVESKLVVSQVQNLPLLAEWYTLLSIQKIIVEDTNTSCSGPEPPKIHMKSLHFKCFNCTLIFLLRWLIISDSNSVINRP